MTLLIFTTAWELRRIAGARWRLLGDRRGIACMAPGLERDRTDAIRIRLMDARQHHPGTCACVS